MFAIGLDKYLVLELNESQLQAHMPAYPTLHMIKLNKVLISYFFYGTITLYGSYFPIRFKLLRLLPYYYIRCNNPALESSKLSRFGLYRFLSTILTVSLLISFPLLTKIFQFRRFPLKVGHKNSYFKLLCFNTFGI